MNPDRSHYQKEQPSAVEGKRTVIDQNAALKTNFEQKLKEKTN